MILKDGLTINTFSFLNLKLLQTKFYNVHSLLLCLTLNLTFNHMDFKLTSIQSCMLLYKEILKQKVIRKTKTLN